MSHLLLNGDCLEELKVLDDNSIDSIVTDPPYGLSFMGKKWDYDVPSIEIWKECLRVLKPGGHLLSFGGTRTYHRLVVNIEDAGFEIRDCIQWLYGSGFPKSHDISKAIDKSAGAEREVIGENSNQRPNSKEDLYTINGDKKFNITAPATLDAKQWQGWGTALKPANEPIVVARKPLEKGLTVAENVLKYGTGAINIDECRISTDELKNKIYNNKGNNLSFGGTYGKGTVQGNSIGRWPANIILDEEAAAALDLQQEGVSRFFYVAKASKSERNAGLEGMPQRKLEDYANGTKRKLVAQAEGPKNPNLPRANHHPTVKPIKLMEYLIKLVTPPNGTVLDPFAGSGSTGVAAVKLGFQFIGIERESEYVKIASKRILAIKK